MIGRHLRGSADFGRYGRLHAGRTPRADATQLEREELTTLYSRATGNRTPRGAIAWAASTLNVTVRTVHRWLTQRTHPQPLDVARLRTAAAVQERIRERPRGLIVSIRGFFASTAELDAAAAERLERERADAIDRACRDRFRFSSDAEWRAFRRKHGGRT